MDDSGQTSDVGFGQGDVLRWHNEHGATSMPAAEYISMLENELVALRKAVRPRASGKGTCTPLVVCCVVDMDLRGSALKF